MNKYALIPLLVFTSFFLNAQCDTTNVSGDLIISTNQSLSGVYIVSGLFKIDSGVTVSVTPYSSDTCGSLIVESNQIEIHGTIDANSAGYAGGVGGSIQSGGVNTNYLSSCANDGSCYVVQVSGGNAGSSGSGPGSGYSGNVGTSGIGPKQRCGNTDDDYGLVGGAGGAGAGAGAAYGGAGGDGSLGGDGALGGGGCGTTASCATPSNGIGGTGGVKGGQYGSIGGSDILMGSGGAGAGSGGKSYTDGLAGANGGSGGGLVMLTANNNLTISGAVYANGGNGGDGGDGGDGGKTARCCSDACDDCSEITYSCGSGAGGGAGGGSGGGIYIKSVLGTVAISGVLQSKGGDGGTGGIGGNGSGSCNHSPLFGICECDGASTPSGNSGLSGGGGGGGRIKIASTRCDDFLPLNINIDGGAGSNNGMSGSIYVSGLQAFSVASGNVYCENDTIDAGPGYDMHWWSTGDSTQTILASDLNTNQFYTVLVKKGNNCYIDTFMVLGGPQASLSPNSAVTLNCGDSVVVDAGNFSSYLWNTGDSTQSIVVDAAGLYSVFVTDSNGCSAYSDTLSVDVLNSFNDTISAAICYGDSFILGSQVLSDSGMYTEKFTSVLNCDSFVTFQLTVYQSAISAALSGPDSVFVNDTALYTISDGDSLIWNVTGGQVINGIGTDTLSIVWDSLAGLGSVYVEVYDSFGCFVDTFEIRVFIQDIATRISENSNLNFKLYPNPAKSTITVELDYNKVQSLNIYDMLGKRVKQIQNIRGPRIVITKESIGSGYYFIEAISNEGSFKQKFKIE